MRLIPNARPLVWLLAGSPLAHRLGYRPSKAATQKRPKLLRACKSLALCATGTLDQAGHLLAGIGTAPVDSDNVTVVQDSTPGRDLAPASRRFPLPLDVVPVHHGGDGDEVELAPALDTCEGSCPAKQGDGTG